MTERFTVSLEAELANAFDEYLRRLGSRNRSEAVRDLIREALVREQLEAQPIQPCIGVLSYFFDHHARSLSKRLTQSHHAHYDLTLASVHVHLDQDHCLETVLLKGNSDAVQAFGESVMTRPGVHHGHLYQIPFGKKGT
ncbi:nickel-responsive transcriptional regulator NikR [Thiorhodospira sibirica]|uniref:nickel-responsive transcriptional regulator NikR n=1 Tax=Thiorhodospira sibirica TaxID=154347 RepID=UPI00022C2857|nr:nickel-responsive transcriptional regulator NikR [Thiorhodospira sibirica]